MVHLVKTICDAKHLGNEFGNGSGSNGSVPCCNQVSVIANNPSTSGKNAHRFYFSGKDVSGLVFISWVRCIGEIEVVCAAFTVQCNY